jgi:hypothetical protein
MADFLTDLRKARFVDCDRFAAQFQQTGFEPFYLGRFAASLASFERNEQA